MARSKAKAVVEDDELDELEELDEVEPAPKKSSSKKAAPKSRRAADEDEEETPRSKKGRRASADDEESTAYGAKWLAEYISEETGKELTSVNIRVLLRKMARDGSLDREVGEDRSRYSFSGPNDPIVKAVLKHVKEGAIEKEKAERVADLKERKAAKKASKAKAAPEPDEDEDEDETEEPAPRKKATRRR